MGGASDERWSCLGQAQRRARFLTGHELRAHVSARTVLDDHHLEEAQALIREAVRMVPSDMLDLRALLHVNLAKVVAASGRDDLARSITDEAVGLYERKGNLVAARSMSDPVTGSNPSSDPTGAGPRGWQAASRQQPER